jgi:acylphosphatase
MRKAEVHCVIGGRVQGVQFRNFARNIATELGLTGFVANLPDGSVEVLAQGDMGVLKVFMNHLRTGPPGAQVRGIYDDWHDAEKEFVGFEVK